ncbi:MAG: hypothetical protein E5X34_13440 [Mesorhizobium sp.]|uniref:hypothetical protein n=1 Tax=Mesorhizobium sp. TaxID=1871066 RepID=UPI0011FE7AF4|nr:hypothetical protein [Mesorhizobium sp.]TIR24052.1 MAG: hypothetical protein E5X34_13440 [Mesorhizobium sp.]
MIKQIEDLSPLSGFLKDLPAWLSDANLIHQEMSQRNIAIETTIKLGKSELKVKQARLDELGPTVRDVGMWGSRLEELLTTNELREAADRIYNEITERVGKGGSEQIRRQLAGILAAMMASNAEVRARADRMREEAERRRSSDVGQDAFDLLSKLVALGSVTQTDPPGDRRKIEFKFEYKEYRYYIPKPVPVRPKR